MCKLIGELSRNMVLKQYWNLCSKTISIFYRWFDQNKSVRNHCDLILDESEAHRGKTESHLSMLLMCIIISIWISINFGANELENYYRNKSFKYNLWLLLWILCQMTKKSGIIHMILPRSYTKCLMYCIFELWNVYSVACY